MYWDFYCYLNLHCYWSYYQDKDGWDNPLIGLKPYHILQIFSNQWATPCVIYLHFLHLYNKLTYTLVAKNTSQWISNVFCFSTETAPEKCHLSLKNYLWFYWCNKTFCINVIVMEVMLLNRTSVDTIKSIGYKTVKLSSKNKFSLLPVTFFLTSIKNTMIINNTKYLHVPYIHFNLCLYITFLVLINRIWLFIHSYLPLYQSLLTC